MRYADAQANQYCHFKGASLMNWQNIFGLISVAVFTVFCNFLSTRYFSKSQQQQSADYNSVRLAAVLERFAFDCASLISIHSAWRASEGNLGEVPTVMPLPQFPADTVWKNLDLMLVGRLLRFENDVRISETVIQADYRHLEYDEYPLEPSAQAGLMGYRAYVLAQDLRVKYPAIGTASKIYPWDFVSILKKQHDLKMAEYANWNSNLD
jgi:hypothetical protein